MFRSNWNVADTIVLVVVSLIALSGIGIGLVQSAGHKISPATSYERPAQEPNSTDSARAPVLPTVSNQVQAQSPGSVPDDAYCQAEQGSDTTICRDLKAQEVMAVAAIAQVVLTAVGLLLVFGTLIYTRDASAAARAAVVEAEKATKAAEAAVEETRLVGQAQVRAYVSAMTPTIFDLRPNAKPYILYRPKNTGQTPAHDYRQTTRWCLATDPNTQKLKLKGPVANRGVGVIAAGEHLEQRTDLGVIAQPLYDAIIAKRLFIVFYGVIRYRDVFGKRRRTVFRKYVNVDTLENGCAAVSACRKNNRST